VGAVGPMSAYGDSGGEGRAQSNTPSRVTAGANAATMCANVLA
jgi:hypothetical protein